MKILIVLFVTRGVVCKASIARQGLPKSITMNTKTYYIILSVFLSSVFAKLPAKLKGKKCPKDSPSTEKCVLRALESLRPFTKKGIPEINIPRMEPFKIRSMNLDAEIPAMTLKGETTNIVAKGASDMVVKSMKLDFKKNEFTATVFIPTLHVTADYDTVGSRITTIDVNGSGQFKGEFHNIEASGTAKCHVRKTKGGEFMKIDEIVDLKIDTGTNPSVKVEPDDNSNTAKLASKVIEKNIGTLLKQSDMHAVMVKAAKPIIIMHVNKILSVVSVDEVFK